jgi:endo-beta-N-acetylglucosaminidase D
MDNQENKLSNFQFHYNCAMRSLKKLENHNNLTDSEIQGFINGTKCSIDNMKIEHEKENIKPDKLIKLLQIVNLINEL